MNSWILHDSFKKKVDAQEMAEEIDQLHLAKGVKVIKNKKYEVYILPLHEKGGE